MAAPGGAPGRPLPAYPSQYWEASALQLCRPGYLRITNIDGTQQAIPVEDLEGLAAQARSTVNQLFADIRAAFGPADDEQPTAGGGTSTPAPETTPNEGVLRITNAQPTGDTPPEPTKDAAAAPTAQD